ncbi:MAG TPA: hypothetical protein VLA23_07425 [Candidatus Limnocylindrales bacterium]|nr:hypothetical protein [Candidatus Limnocylindrales bacterium]
MPKTQVSQASIVDRILHRGAAAPTAAEGTTHAGHPFVSGSGGTHPTGRGTGGWVLLDDSGYEAHVCQVCGHPEADPRHGMEPPEDD